MGGSPLRGVFPREYARSGHSGAFYLHNLKVFTLRILQNSVGKVEDFENVQERHVLLRESARSRHYGVFYLQNLKVSTLRILKNSVGKVDDFAYVQK